MSRAAARPGSLGAGRSRAAGRWIDRAAAVTVAGLAGIAGALSYSHMRQLAQDHGQAGWHAHTFPLSVDGVEIVASLVLLADRRAGRRSGWLPWAALAAGTAGSLAANIAAARPDPVSRIIAGWPALALLLAVKLLSGILQYPATADSSAAIPEPAPRATDPDIAGELAGHRLPAPFPVPESRAPAGIVNTQPSQHDLVSSAPSPGSAAGRAARPSRPAGAVSTLSPGIAELLPAAFAARDELDRDGTPLTRDALAARLRQHGHPVRNERVTPLLRHLRNEHRHIHQPQRPASSLLGQPELPKKRPSTSAPPGGKS